MMRLRMKLLGLSIVMEKVQYKETVMMMMMKM
jgi:hypothetical protein